MGVIPFEASSFKASLVRDGSARVEGNFEPFTVTAGDLVLMRPGTRFGSLSSTPVDAAVLQVHPAFLVDQVRWTRPRKRRDRRETYESIRRNTRRPIVLHLRDDTFLRVAELYAQAAFLSSRPSALRQMIARSTELIWEIEELLATGRPAASWTETLMASPLPGRFEVQEVIRAMHERYASDLSIRDLAREVALSESALSRAVLAATGFAPREHLHRIRLIRFEQLVAETTLPLAEATRLVGWSSTSHARSVFARSHGMSPSEYRAEVQAARRADWLRTFGA